MAVKKEELAQRVQDSYRKLSEVATALNTASDKLGASISLLDLALKKLSLGISSWVHFNEVRYSDGISYLYEDVGYTKLGGKWGLAIRTVPGNEVADEQDDPESWPFNEAPRALRVRAVVKIPDLLEKLIADASAVIKTVDEQTEVVDALADSIADTPTNKRRNVAQMMADLQSVRKGPIRRVCGKHPSRANNWREFVGGLQSFQSKS